MIEFIPIALLVAVILGIPIGIHVGEGYHAHLGDRILVGIWSGIISAVILFVGLILMYLLITNLLVVVAIVTVFGLIGYILDQKGF